MDAFDKSTEAFPGRERHVFLLSCGASPLPAVTLDRMVTVARLQADGGGLAFGSYEETLDGFHHTVARLLGTSADAISFQRNTTEGISLVADGYPFRPGDEVISYVHEYPANPSPWRNLERRGVRLVELPNVITPGNEVCGRRPCAFSLEDLEERITARTRVVALSTAQFASGFALDVEATARICRDRGVDLVLDAAQSLGSLPLHPEQHGVAAVVASGWKWLLGPIGSGLMYTSPALREKLGHVVVGAETMQQGTDYLDHTWSPHDTAKRFEYATSSPALVAALETSISAIHLRYGVGAIRDEILRLQDLLVDQLDPELYVPVIHPTAHRSGVLCVAPLRRQPEELVELLLDRGFVCSARAGYLRLAPHFFVTDEEIERLAGAMNDLR